MIQSDQEQLVEQLGAVRDKYNNLLLKITQFRNDLEHFEVSTYATYYISGDAVDDVKQAVLDEFDQVFEDYVVRPKS